MKKIDNLKTALGWLILAALFFWIASLCGCSSVKKIKSSVYKKTDSSAVSFTHESGTRKHDSLAVKKDKQEFKNSIDIVFDDDTSAIGIISGEDPEERATDLAGPKKIISTIHTVTINGKEITSTRPMKSLNIKMAGNVSSIDLTRLVSKDSGQQSISTKVEVAKTQETKNKDVERHGANVLVWIGISVVLVAGFILAAKFGVFRKRNFTS